MTNSRIEQIMISKKLYGFDNLQWCLLMIAQWCVIDTKDRNRVVWIDELYMYANWMLMAIRLPLYNEIKVAFCIYLWHPNTKGNEAYKFVWSTSDCNSFCSRHWTRVSHFSRYVVENMTYIRSWISLHGFAETISPSEWREYWFVPWGLKGMYVCASEPFFLFSF